MTAHWTTPGQRWALLAPREAVAVGVPSGPLAVRRATQELRALPPGTPVVLLDHRPGARLRARRIAAAGAMVVNRQYVALPSLRRVVVVAEDTTDTLRWACWSLVAPPPGVTWAHALADAAVAFLRRRPRAAGSLRRTGRRREDAMSYPAAQAQQPARPDTAGMQPPVADLRALLNATGSRTVLLDASRDPNSSITVLVTAPGEHEPHLAVKVATTRAAAAVIEREAEFLTQLRRLTLPRVSLTLPQPAGVFDADGLPAVATTVVPGVPMRAGYHAYRHLRDPVSVRADFTAAGNWLAALHADSLAEAAPIALLDGVAERITARWPGNAHAAALAGRLGPVAARLASASTPRTVVHGDFWAGNLLVTGDRITGVVDWASGELSGEPLRDVARFVLSYSLYLDRHTRPGRKVAGHPGLRADGWGAGVRHAFTGQGWFGDLVRGFVATALTRLGAPSRLWRDALLAGLAEVAATADHPDFAARHRDLLVRLIDEVPQ